ncbi:Uncharacterised protein [Streptococcus pneumoniae]|nr:Uncharacterised protein [Streptococcus pneumoniae]
MVFRFGVNNWGLSLFDFLPLYLYLLLKSILLLHFLIQVEKVLILFQVEHLKDFHLNLKDKC